MEYVDTSELPEQLFLDNPEDRAVMLNEAIARMQRLSMSTQAINALRRGDVWMSEGIGALYDIPEDDPAFPYIGEVEGKGMFPYHVIHTFTEIGQMYAFLVVSGYPEEWEDDRADLENGIALADVFNVAWELDDLGSIGIRPNIGGLIRTA